MSGTNTYKCATDVAEGTLRLAGGDTPGVLPTNGVVRVTGGTLDLGGNEQTVRALVGTAGAVANGTLTLPTALTVDVAEAKAGDCLTFAGGSFAFPANATLTLTNTQAINPDDKTYTLLKITGAGSFANLPRLTNDDLEPWTLTLGAGGREVRLAFPRGTMLIFR